MGSENGLNRFAKIGGHCEVTPLVKSGRRQAGPSAINLAVAHRTAHHPHAKGLDTIGTGSFEEIAIRPHTLGKFRALHGTTARHPAMLFYLDNWQNSARGL